VTPLDVVVHEPTKPGCGAVPVLPPAPIDEPPAPAAPPVPAVPPAPAAPLVPAVPALPPVPESSELLQPTKRPSPASIAKLTFKAAFIDGLLLKFPGQAVKT
jgi:hypothetical protein